MIAIDAGERNALKFLGKSEDLAVLRDPLIVAMEKFQPVYGSDAWDYNQMLEGSSGTENPMEQWSRKLGFNSSNSYYNFVGRRTASRWVVLDKADRILCGMGAQYMLNTGEIIIYRLGLLEAVPLPYE